jgi:hypothetical protein
MSAKEIGTGDQGEEIVEIASPDDIDALAGQTVQSLNADLLPENMTENLAEFLRSVYNSPSFSTIAFVDRREEFVRPILGIYVLLSSPLQVSCEEQMREMDKIEDEHSRLLEEIEPYLDSLLTILDPGNYPSPEDLQIQLSDRFASLTSSGVIAFLTNANICIEK